jgi:anti-sigma B factor antagonist
MPVMTCQMVIEPLDDDGGVRVVVNGELAGPSAYTLDAELRKVEEARPHWLLLDLSGLAFIDSAGLARLLAAHRRAKREGRRLIVVEGTGAVRRLIALTALNQQLEVFADASSAVAVVHA